MSDMDGVITQEAAETAEAQEWDSAFGKFDADKGIKPEVDENKVVTPEPAKVEDEKNDDEETPEQKAEREKQEAEEAAKKAETDEEAQARRDAAARAREVREASRDYMADTESVKNDVMQEMFGDKDGKLYDADGDEISTIADVMALRNPNTGKNFTEDEAGAYLLKASQNAQQEREEALAQAAEIADQLVSLKDQADTVKDKYGDFLNDPANAALKAEVWADYEATFVVDKESGIITKAPVSMIRFYDRALRPYVEAQSTVSSAEQARAQAEAEAAKAKAEASKARTRSDREDIFARGDNGRNTLTKEETEWADAEQSYYGKK